MPRYAEAGTEGEGVIADTDHCVSSSACLLVLVTTYRRRVQHLQPRAPGENPRHCTSGYTPLHLTSGLRMCCA